LFSPEKGKTNEGGGQSSLTEISNGAVQLFRRYTGRGPTETRAYTQGDLVVIVLRNALTSGERAMVEAGHEADVLRMRAANQEAMRSGLVSLVEEHLGRNVLHFSSHNSVDPDIAVELFVLDGSKPKG
jgi:uncharacterized protein YbcI